MNDTPARPVLSARIDHIPALWVAPDPALTPPRLALWLPYFTGTKEDMVDPYLQDLAASGFVALSLDPWQHGERGTATAEALAARVFGDVRRHMWPILGQTALDALRAIDWALAHLAITPPVRLGGVSMGGDIAVAVAGLDRRIDRVAALVATPDWLRPGMRAADDPTRLVPPGAPDAYARFFYDQLNPLTHLASYAHRPALAFECGADDTHVPPDGALRFQAALRARDPAGADRVRVTLHTGVGHEADPALWREARDWLTRAHDGPP